MGKRQKGGKGGGGKQKRNAYQSLDDDNEDEQEEAWERGGGGRSNKKNGKKRKGPKTAYDGSRDVEFRQMIEANGRRSIRDMAADGNCLFRSLSDQLYGDYGNRHERVRQEVCDYLQAHSEEFAVFLLMDDEAEDVTDFESYLKEMRLEACWGGNVELVAASRLYGHGIHVFSSAVQSVWTIDCPDSPDASNVLQISHHDLYHYNSVFDQSTHGQLPARPLRKPPLVLEEKSRKVQASSSSSAVPTAAANRKKKKAAREKQQEDTAPPTPTTTTAKTETAGEATNGAASTNEEDTAKSAVTSATATETTTTNATEELHTKSNNELSVSVDTHTTEESTTTTTDATRTSCETRNATKAEQDEGNDDDDAEDEEDKKKGQKRNGNTIMTTKRNDECHCGSGLRYKKCCLTGDKSRARMAKFRAQQGLPQQESKPDETTTTTTTTQMTSQFKTLQI